MYMRIYAVPVFDRYTIIRIAYGESRAHVKINKMRLALQIILSQSQDLAVELH